MFVIIVHQSSIVPQRRAEWCIVFIKDSLTNDKELYIFLELNLQNKQSIMTRASYPQILSDSEKVQSTSQTN